MSRPNAATATAPRATRLRPTREWLLSGWTSLIVFLVAWQLIGTLGVVDPFFISSPSRILATAAEQIPSADFWSDARISMTEFAVGYLLALLVGVPLAIIAGWYRWIGYAIEPWLNAFNATPRIALLPLIAVWFGIGTPSTTALVFIGVFFTVAINVFYGVGTVSRKYLALAASFDAGDLMTLRTIVLPGMVPFIVSGARLGIGRGVIGVVVGEFYSSSNGLGNAIFRASATLNIDQVLFGAIVITVLALFAYVAVGRLENWFERWRTDANTRAA
jgi:NitT/TauT family transport system permease protein